PPPRPPLFPYTTLFRSSLGATLFHLLTGRPPFLGTSAFDLIAKLRSESPPLVSTLNGAVGEAVCQVVARALAKRPVERYRDAGEDRKSTRLNSSHRTTS